jgi:hypothetical protein
MSRLILTFPTLTQVLAADKMLRDHVQCRPTPTPAGLSADICGVSIELLEQQQKQQALSILEEAQLKPSGIHELN